MTIADHIVAGLWAAADRRGDNHCDILALLEEALRQRDTMDGDTEAAIERGFDLLLSDEIEVADGHKLRGDMLTAGYKPFAALSDIPA